jgi:hypothetical protein
LVKIILNIFRFINYSSSISGVPIYIFFPSVVFGLLPFHYLSVNAGIILNQIKSTKDIYDLKVIILLIIFSIFIILPAIFKNKIVKYYENK